MGQLKQDLEASGLELIETHISWVFLNRTEVFKVKRPVDFGFLDFTTVEARLRACEAEVDLNRRLASDVYLGVLPVTEDSQGVHSIDGEGRTVDWAVHMRRLDERDRADCRIGRAALTLQDVDALAVRIAEFHDSARCDEETTRHGAPDVIRRNVQENFDQTRASIGEYLTEAEAREIEAWQLRVLADETRFEARQRAGRVRDGHGDLRLEHVYFDEDSISIIDCIEFNERFRYGDVCADIAFLSMDLAWHGRVDLAERLLATYARETSDYGLYSVVNFYESYRAFVRGKIASFLAADVEASTESRERARSEARRYFMLSLAFERPPLVPPRVVAVGGLIASGKSRSASVIGGLLAAPVIGSDRLRKHLMGRRADQSMQSEAWSGPYSAEMTARVYEALWRAAETVVTSLAERLGVPFTFVECMAPRERLLERLAKRDSLAAHESDARPGLLDEFEKRFEPVEELRSAVHVRIDTSRPQEENLERLRSLFEV